MPTLETLEDRWVPSGMSSVGDGLANLLAVPAASTSATQTQEVDAAFAAFPTGGSQTQTIAQFNPTLGTLTGIQIINNGTLTSDVKVENLDNAPSNVSAQINGNLSLQGPGFQSLSVNPSLSENTTLSASDGGTSFGGTAGHDFGAQSAQASQAVTLSTGQNDLSAWVGSGTVSLTESAQSSSTLTGSGNLMAQTHTTASGSVRVIYSYTPAPPPAPPPVTPPPVAPPPVTPSTPGSCTPPAGPGSISGIVYVDPNHSGQYTVGDAGVPNVTVNLTGFTLSGQTVNQTTTTAVASGMAGVYSFTNLQPGIYTLSSVQPTGYLPGAETLGNLGGIVQGSVMILALPQGGNAMCYDFGEVPPPSPPVAPSAGVVPPPAVVPPSNDPPADPPATTPVVISKRSLLGNGWWSLG